MLSLFYPGVGFLDALLTVSLRIGCNLRRVGNDKPDTFPLNLLKLFLGVLGIESLLSLPDNFGGVVVAP